jgi:hypothetical protein
MGLLEGTCVQIVFDLIFKSTKLIILIKCLPQLKYYTSYKRCVRSEGILPSYIHNLLSNLYTNFFLVLRLKKRFQS